MDDNIINVNILNLFDNNKILYSKAHTENDCMDSIQDGITTDTSWFKLDYVDNHPDTWHWKTDSIG